MRLELTLRSDYAFRVLDILSRSPRTMVSGPQIARSLDISSQYLATIMAPLTQSGWVRSSSGPSGGYRLAAQIGERSVLDLVESVEGGADRTRCMHGDRMRPVDEPCALHEPWTRARDALLDELARTPLRTVLTKDG